MNECNANLKMIYLEAGMSVASVVFVDLLCLLAFVSAKKVDPTGAVIVCAFMVLFDIFLLYYAVHTYRRKTDTLTFYPTYFTYRNHEYSMEHHTYHILQYRTHILGIIPLIAYDSVIQDEQGKTCVSSKYIKDIPHAFYQYYYGGQNGKGNYHRDCSDRFDHNLRFGEGTHQQEKRF